MLPRRIALLGTGAGLVALFATGLFAGVGVSAPRCNAKHTSACPPPSSTTTTTSTGTTTTGTTTTTATTTTATTTTATTTTATTTTTTSSGPTVVDELVTPEGATIQIYSDATGGWTAQQVYDLLKPNAYQLGLIGPMLTVEVQGQYASSTSAGAGYVDGAYTNYHATIYLQAASGSTFSSIPEAIIAHEYGHAWSLYHYYMTEGGDWTSYLYARSLYGDPLLDTSYMWSTREIVAEDYRLLFGTQAAQDELAQTNYQIPDARTVAGLKDFLANVWGA